MTALWTWKQQSLRHPRCHFLEKHVGNVLIAGLVDLFGSQVVFGVLQRRREC